MERTDPARWSEILLQAQRILRGEEDSGTELRSPEDEDLRYPLEALLESMQRGVDLEAADLRRETWGEFLSWHDALRDRLAAYRAGDEDQRDGIAVALDGIARSLDKVRSELEVEASWVSLLLRREI